MTDPQRAFGGYSHPRPRQRFDQVRAHAEGFDSLDPLEFETEAGSVDPHLVADRQPVEDGVVGEVDHDVLGAAVLADDAPLGAFGFSVQHSHPIADACQSVEAAALAAGAAAPPPRLYRVTAGSTWSPAMFIAESPERKLYVMLPVPGTRGSDPLGRSCRVGPNPWWGDESLNSHQYELFLIEIHRGERIIQVSLSVC